MINCCRPGHICKISYRALRKSGKDCIVCTYVFGTLRILPYHGYRNCDECKFVFNHVPQYRDNCNLYHWSTIMSDHIQNWSDIMVTLTVHQTYPAQSFRFPPYPLIWQSIRPYLIIVLTNMTFGLANVRWQTVIIVSVEHKTMQESTIYLLLCQASLYYPGPYSDYWVKQARLWLYYLINWQKTILFLKLNLANQGYQKWKIWTHVSYN